ncbi:nitroreductase family protein [Aureimonas altamirensis]|uniref:nitroreductase family protein n=1 Tax=Aureimonas altamirensis TaxID=370622 RepID=UPI002554D5CE|nr:nitroreductase family protein [Aureimonas altamirensis]
MKKHAVADHPIDPTLMRRWSPRSFDDRRVDQQDLNSLFEAARWSPSANNIQPWSFIVALKGTDAFKKLVGCLNETNAVWASKAAVLIVACAAKYKPDGSEHPSAMYDLGQSVAHLTFQATVLNLHIHQMGGFKNEETRRAFAIPDTYQPVTVLALGYLGGPTNLPPNLLERELAQRDRKSASEFVFFDEWGLSRQP